MVYQVDRIVHDVRVAIDMNRADTNLLADRDEDTLRLDDLIASKIVDVCRQILLEAPAAKLESGHTLDAGQMEWESDHSGFIRLPDDFLRLIAFRMSDWKRTVWDTIEAESPAYAMQSSEFGGIRGNSERPVCAIIRRSDGKVLEFFGSLSRASEITRADYQPVPMIDSSGGVDLPRECYRACVYRIAGVTLGTYGDQLGATMTEMSKTLLQ